MREHRTPTRILTLTYTPGASSNGREVGEQSQDTKQQGSAKSTGQR